MMYETFRSLFPTSPFIEVSLYRNEQKRFKGSYTYRGCTVSSYAPVPNSVIGKASL